MKKSLVLKVILSILGLGVFLWIVLTYIARPFEIVGTIGRLKNGDYAFGVSKDLLMGRGLRKDDIVIYEIMDSDAYGNLYRNGKFILGIVKGLPDKEQFPNYINPRDFYIIQKPNDPSLYQIPINQVLYLIWYP